MNRSRFARKFLTLALALCAPALSYTASAQAATCGEATSVALLAGQSINAGSVELYNDETTLYVRFSLDGGWEMTESHVHVASTAEAIPQTRSGNPKIGNFDYKREYNPALTSDTYEIPLDSIDGFSSCGDAIAVAAHAAVQLRDGGTVVQAETAWGEGTGFPGRSWAMYINSVVQCCDPVAGCPEQNRTQTQGGWGSSCNGNNPGCYRDANFDACFGIGFVIGGSPHSAAFTNSYAVETFLPQGGKPAPLDMHYTDPTSTSGGVLAGQVTALSLSVGFDDCDPSFGSSSVRLGDMVIVDAASPCHTWTVDQVLAAGNCVLSGATNCGIQASEINACLTTINEAFVDGTGNTGDVCVAP